MGRFKNAWTISGMLLLFLGSGPLWIVILTTATGIWPGNGINPLTPGLLFFVTFWPAVALLAIGLIKGLFRGG
ncbi:hypothetical protein IRY61_04250 [Candidatus Saccharibacteria bacterium]|jgi:hypothetical protein|nr:hypothetical protein [Candidatus Saccharibacteria bacterium]